MTVYISGPITGADGWQERFDKAESEYAGPGRVFESPVRISKDVEGRIPNPSYSDYLREDILRLVGCDAVLMLPQWQMSKGARLEHHIAMVLGLEIAEYPNKFTEDIE